MTTSKKITTLAKPDVAPATPTTITEADKVASEAVATTTADTSASVASVEVPAIVPTPLSVAEKMHISVKKGTLQRDITSLFGASPITKVAKSTVTVKTNTQSGSKDVVIGVRSFKSEYK